MLKLSLYSFLIASLFSLAFITHKKTIPDCQLYGVILDKATGKPIPSASVNLYKTGVLLSTTNADATGNYCFNTIKTGTYNVVVTHPGYPSLSATTIVSPGKKLKLDLRLKATVSLHEIELSQVSEADEEKRPAPHSHKLKRESMAYSEPKKSWSGSHNKDIVVSPGDQFNTEDYNKIDDNEFKDVKKNPLSTFSIDVDKASYSNVRRFITQGQLPPADAVRVEEMINYFSYSYPQPKGDKPFSISMQSMNCPWNKKHQLIHVGIKGKEINLENMPANNLVFLLDVSGSMNYPDKLPLLKSGLNLLIDQMRPQDHIAIVVYAGAAGVVLPSTSGKEKGKIKEALEQLQAGGSTAGGEGILLAYKTARENFLKDGNNRIILATDGDFNVGISSDGELVRLVEKQKNDGVFLTVLGFGTGNYKDSRMEQLADKGNGNYAYIDNILEAKKTLVKEMGGTLLTIAKDVKIQVEFNPAKIKGYRLVGYENRLLNNKDFNDDKKDAGELGSGHQVTAIYEIIPAESEELIASVDSLKYQRNFAGIKNPSSDMMTIKFRYKEPKAETSQLITEVLSEKKYGSLVSQDALFSAAVAEFGMLLRDSKFKGDASFNSVLEKARLSKGKDEDGYRAEFIRLVEMAQLLSAK